MTRKPAFLLAALLALAPEAKASFQATPTSIKAEAMGGAFVAMADDASAVFVNPAGLTGIASPQATFMYGKPFYGLEGIDLSQGYAALALPVARRFTAAAGATAFQSPGILGEYQGTLGMSALVLPRFAVGAGASYLYHDYFIGKDSNFSQMSEFSNGTSKGALAFHLGFLALPTKFLQLGASVRNLNMPNVGLKERDPVAREIRAGAMLLGRYANVLAEIEDRDTGLGGVSSQNTWRVGLEVPVSAFAIRAGANSDAMTAGFGFRYGYMGLDYAFTMPRATQAGHYGGQYLALSFLIGPSRPASASAAKSGKAAAANRQGAQPPARTWYDGNLFDWTRKN